jgi:tetratricopeptide (TPR) repeat protein
MAAGDRAYSAGRLAEAGAAYDDAAREAVRPADREEAIYEAGQSYRRAGQLALALARFDWLTEHGLPYTRGPRGALEAGLIRLEHGEPERAQRDLTALMRRWPDTGPARRALALLLMQRDESDPSGATALALIDAELPALRPTQLGTALMYERGQRLEHLERLEEAVVAYETLLTVPYPLNTHQDDGGLALARLLLRMGRARQAVEVIGRVLAVHETAPFVPGSATRPRFPELQMLRARIERDELHDPAAAARSFHTLYAEFTTSRLRDDALDAEAELRVAMGQRGEACALYAQLAREFPCTRFGRRGREEATRCGASVSVDVERECHHPPRHPSASVPPTDD